jgi:hypothetical protein
LSVRFTDILTTASAVADYLGEPEVKPGHVLEAIAILRGERDLPDLGRGVSPLVPRGAGRGLVAQAVRDLVQEWFERLRRDVTAELSEGALASFEAEVLALESDEVSGS